MTRSHGGPLGSLGMTPDVSSAPAPPPRAPRGGATISESQPVLPYFAAGRWRWARRSCLILRALRGDHGSAPAAVLAWCAVGGLVLAATLAVGVADVMHTRAQATADLAALAGADAHAIGLNACGLAGEVAGRNGAELSSCAVAGQEVHVTVAYTVDFPGFGIQRVQADAIAGPDPTEGIQGVAGEHG